MRITKVYTRTGDTGRTRLAGGQQVWKDSLRVEAYGTADELNSSLGLVRVFNADEVRTRSEAAQLEQQLITHSGALHVFRSSIGQVSNWVGGE